MATMHGEDNLSQDLNCPICLELLTDPVTLYNCFHSFCRPCLAGSIRGARGTYRHPYSCPQCRRHFLPSDVDKVNHHLQSIVSSHRKAQEIAAAEAEERGTCAKMLESSEPTRADVDTLTNFMSTVDARLQCLISALEETSFKTRDTKDRTHTASPVEASVNSPGTIRVETNQLDECSRLRTPARSDCDFEAETLNDFAHGALNYCKKHFILIMFVIHACVLLLLLVLAMT